MVSLSGVRMFIDAFYEPLEIAFESEGFVAHAEKITRDRFNFERVRVRTMALYGYNMFPLLGMSWIKSLSLPSYGIRNARASFWYSRAVA